MNIDYFIIMENNEPSIEDLRAEIINYKKEIDQQKVTIDNLNNQLSTKDTTIESLNKDIGNLKQKNYDLFMKVSNNPQEPPKEKTVEVISLDTIIQNLRGEN